MWSRETRPRQSFTALGIGAVILPIFGCGAAAKYPRANSTPGIAKPAESTPLKGLGTQHHLMVGCDITLSTGTSRQKILSLLEQAAQSLPPGGRFDLLTFDRRPHWLAVDIPPTRRAIRRHARRLLAVRDTGYGTYLDQLLQELYARCVEKKDQPAAILILTDGEDHHPAQSAAWAKRLANLPNIRVVWVAGLDSRPGSGLVGQARQTFAPFGERLILTGDLDGKAGLTKFQRLVSGERS